MRYWIVAKSVVAYRNAPSCLRIKKRRFVAVKKYADGAFAFPGESFFDEIIDNSNQTIVIKTFAELFVEFYTQSFVKLLDVA